MILRVAGFDSASGLIPGKGKHWSRHTLFLRGKCGLQLTALSLLSVEARDLEGRRRAPGEARRRRHGGGGLPHVMCGARVGSGVRECASGPGAYGLGARRRPSASNSILEKGILWIPFEGNSRRVIWQVYTRRVRAMCRAHPATILGIVRNLYTLTRAPVT